MSSYLCISIRFADPMFRGRGDGGEPEWPPSPLRVFQSLVAAAAARFGNPDRFRDYAAPAFAWLGGLHPPVVIAPPGDTGAPFRTAVPNNDMDVVAADWARGDEPRKQPAALKTLKQIRPTHLRGREEFPAVHYAWHVPDAARAECEKHKETLFAAARSVVALGWGVDMALGLGQMLEDSGLHELKGDRWNPTSESGSRLRVPIAGTFDDLVRRHHNFVNRLPLSGGFRPVPPLTAFNTVGYRRDTESTPRPFAAFELNKSFDDMATQSTGSRFRPFETTRWAVAVAGMVRHATAVAALQSGRPEVWINTFVHGHTANGEDRATGDAAEQRFAFLPLPSIEHRGPKGKHVGMVRRVLIVGPPGGEEQVNWGRRALSGQELIEDGGRPIALLSAIPNADTNLQSYVASSRTWSTVTPVVLHRHAPAAHEVRGLLVTAFQHAGFPAALANGLELEWRNVGYRAGVDLASRYCLPDRLTGPRYHVRVVFPHPIRGPLVVGAGRYRGLGLFATENS